MENQVKEVRKAQTIVGAFLTTTMLVTACATVPDLGTAPVVKTVASRETVKSFAAPERQWPSDTWWRAYGDNQLTALIEEALADAPTLEAAKARMRGANAALTEAGALRQPSVSAKGSINATRRDFSADNLSADIESSLPDDWTTESSSSLRLDYQLDFFGRNKAAIAAATSSADAASADAAAARLHLSAAVALAYADLSRLFADRFAASEIVRLREDSARLVKQRFSAGLENEGQLGQANSETARALGALVSIDGDIAHKRNEIAALMGKGPDRGLAITAPATPVVGSPGLPRDISVDLIGRRPDLTAARLRAEAAGKRIDVAHADFYPNVNLAAVIGLQTFGIDDLGGGELGSIQAGPAISLPIFSGGRLRGAYEKARAEYDEAVASYNQTLADALKETADAISGQRTLAARLEYERASLEAAETSYRVTRARYEGGLAGYFDVLAVENGLVTQRRTVASLETHAFALDVALVRALGGGFSSPTAIKP